MNNIFAYDLETTSADVQTAKIISMSYRVIQNNEVSLSETVYFNPGVPIPAESTQVHGITNEDVKDCPVFSSHAAKLESILTAEGLILCGYNNRMFDDIILERELNDAGHSVSLFGMPCIDLLALWRVQEPRTLTGAMKRFLGEEMQNAHDAAADTDAVVKLLPVMIDQLGLTGDKNEINTQLFPEQAAWVDRQGKLVKNDAGDICLNFGKNKGVPLKDCKRDYLMWVMNQEFPAETKQIIKQHM